MMTVISTKLIIYNYTRIVVQTSHARTCHTFTHGSTRRARYVLLHAARLLIIKCSITYKHVMPLIAGSIARDVIENALGAKDAGNLHIQVRNVRCFSAKRLMSAGLLENWNYLSNCCRMRLNIIVMRTDIVRWLALGFVYECLAI